MSMSSEATISSQVKLFVGNLPFAATARTLEDLFSPFGELRGAKLVHDRKTRKPRGFGFVTFIEECAAEKALALNNQIVDGRPLTVRRAVARGTGSLKEQDEDDDELKSGKFCRPHETAPLCRFMASPEGCRFGSRCRYAHSMNNWTGPVPSGGGRTSKEGGGVRVPKRSSSPKVSDLKSDAIVTDPVANSPAVLPKSAAFAIKERLSFLKDKVKTDGEPSPPQLGAFLHSVVDVLRASLDKGGGFFDMETLGWDYRQNRSIPKRPPPTVEEAVRWLTSPTFVPVPSVSLEEFQARSKSGNLPALLAEYGDYDPDWNKPVGAASSTQSR